MQERVRAIIIENNSLLTIKRVKEKEVYWVLPGGGIEDGETNEQALIRECKEELGVEVKIGKLVFENSYVHEKFGAQHEFFYFCKIIGGTLGTGEGPEYQENSGYEGTHEIEWLKMRDIEFLDFRPKKCKNLLKENKLYLHHFNY